MDACLAHADAQLPEFSMPYVSTLMDDANDVPGVVPSLHTIGDLHWPNA